MRRKSVVLLLSAAVLLLAQRDAKRERPVRQSVRGMRAAVAAGSDYAAEAGMRILHKGGNAVDGGLAAMFAASVSEFSHFGFGGEAPILIRTKDGRVFSIAGVGTMPKMASAEFFRTRRILAGELLALEPGGLKGMIPVAGLMPALVPGMVEAGLVALQEFGTMSFRRRDRARNRSGRWHAAGRNARECHRPQPAVLRALAHFEGTSSCNPAMMPNPGDIFRQPDLARTLRAMVAAEQRRSKHGASRKDAIDAVRDYFYRGEIAHKIDAFSKANGGLLRYEDMAAFRLKPEEPAERTYRGYKVYKPGFWSQGPVFLQALNMLEPDDLAALGHNTAEYLHKIVETLKLAYADRDTYYGDPAFAKVRGRHLLSKEYAAQRRTEIVPHASTRVSAGHDRRTSRAPSIALPIWPARASTTN